MDDIGHNKKKDGLFIVNTNAYNYELFEIVYFILTPSRFLLQFRKLEIHLTIVIWLLQQHTRAWGVQESGLSSTGKAPNLLKRDSQIVPSRITRIELTFMCSHLFKEGRTTTSLQHWLWLLSKLWLLAFRHIPSRSRQMWLLSVTTWWTRDTILLQVRQKIT